MDVRGIGPVRWMRRIKIHRYNIGRAYGTLDWLLTEANLGTSEMPSIFYETHPVR